MQIQRTLQVAMIGLVAPLLAPAAEAGDLSIGFDLRLGGGSRIEIGYRGGKGYRRGHDRRRLATRRIWVQGRFELVSERIWVPAEIEKVWIGPVYETRLDGCGRPVRVLVRPGTWRRVRRPGHWEIDRHEVWRPGYWTTTDVCY